MPIQSVPEENQPVTEMNSFLLALPCDVRNYVGKLLLRCRKHLSTTILSGIPIKQYTRCIHALCEVFIGLPFSLRKNLKLIILNGLSGSLSGCSTSFAIFTTCLCLLDLHCTRNADRLDLEADDISVVVDRLNSEILPLLGQSVTSKRTNIPDLYSWSISTIIFTYRAALDWLSDNNYFERCSTKILIFDPAVLSHCSLPAVMIQLLKLQTRQRSYPCPPKPYTLWDVVFGCAISDNIGLMQQARIIPKFKPDVSPLEFAELPSRKRPRNCKQQATVVQNASSDKLYLTAHELEQFLLVGSPSECIDHLTLLRKTFFSENYGYDGFENLVSVALRHSTALLVRINVHQENASRCVSTRNVKSANIRQSQQGHYEQAVILLLQIWFRAAERRLLLTILPQSYLWLAAFTRIDYKAMTLTGFAQTMVWLSRFLTAYQALFRSAILTSPHWYLQLISDAVVAIIDRLETAETERLPQIRETMCACIASISRPFHVLGIDEPTVRPEMSRVVKVVLETIVCRMATCQARRSGTPQQAIWTHKSQTTATADAYPVLTSRIRDCLFTHLIQTIITSIDPWALGQARIGARPASAKVLLKQLLADAGHNLEAGWTEIAVAGRRAERLVELPKAAPAVGGLKVTEKLASTKRRRR